MPGRTDTPAWPAHRYELLPWRQASRGGTRDDRMLREITVAMPPMIAELPLVLDAAVVADCERAMREVTALDGEGSNLQALNVLLLRTESIASSKIEAIEAGVDDYARALHGIRSNASAVSMVAATTALHSMIDAVTPGDRIDLAAITSAHAVLMKDDVAKWRHAGRLRDVQNWIGGSDHAPRAALYIPPPPQSVRDYMDDLIAFANRDELPILGQAAIAHAQFESIHPFTDGNGRIGRALINSVLRRRGATTRVVVPLASALVARREQYFDLLNAYRAGSIAPLVTSFARATRVAAAESRTTAVRLRDLPAEWRAAVGATRRDSATAKLLDILPARPILSADDITPLLDAPRSSVFAAIARLHDAGILRPLTDRTRNQIWGAAAVLDELDDLGRRIAAD